MWEIIRSKGELEQCFHNDYDDVHTWSIFYKGGINTSCEISVNNIDLLKGITMINLSFIEYKKIELESIELESIESEFKGQS